MAKNTGKEAVAKLAELVDAAKAALQAAMEHADENGLTIRIEGMDLNGSWYNPTPGSDKAVANWIRDEYGFDISDPDDLETVKDEGLPTTLEEFKTWSEDWENSRRFGWVNSSSFC